MPKEKMPNRGGKDERKDGNEKEGELLFLTGEPLPGEKGYYEKGYRPDPEHKGFILDEKGNRYDEAYNLVEVADDDAVRIAAERYPQTVGTGDFWQMVRMIRRRLEREAREKGEKEKNDERRRA